MSSTLPEPPWERRLDRTTSSLSAARQILLPAALGRSVMTNRAAPNLSSKDSKATVAFLERSGFERAFLDRGWMILEAKVSSWSSSPTRNSIVG